MHRQNEPMNIITKTIVFCFIDISPCMGIEAKLFGTGGVVAYVKAEARELSGALRLEMPRGGTAMGARN